MPLYQISLVNELSSSNIDQYYTFFHGLNSSCIDHMSILVCQVTCENNNITLGIDLIKRTILESYFLIKVDILIHIISEELHGKSFSESENMLPYISHSDNSKHLPSKIDCMYSGIIILPPSSLVNTIEEISRSRE